MLTQTFLSETRHALRVAFSESVRTSIGSGDVTVTRVGDGAVYAPTSVEYDRQSHVATFVIATPLPDGRYRATINAGAVTDVAGNLLPATSPYEFSFLAGDANRDGRVNLADFNILASNFGQSNRTFGQGDFNYDGVVNLIDFNLLAARFGTVLDPDAELA